MALMQRFEAGWRGLITGERLNQLVDRVNGLVNGTFKGVFNGTLGATTPSTAAVTTLNASGASTLAATSVTDFTQNGIWTQSVQAIAAAGSNSQSAATAITKSTVVVTTVSATTRAVRLPTAATGKRVFINNGAGTAVKVYPATGDKIGAAATNAVGTAIASLKGNIYLAKDAVTWLVMTGA